MQCTMTNQKTKAKQTKTKQKTTQTKKPKQNWFLPAVLIRIHLHMARVDGGVYDDP